MLNRQRRRFTPEEYLAIEERSSVKSEYCQGELYAMTGGSIEHNQILRNLALELGEQLKSGPCQLFVADLRLQVAAHDMFTYPDLFVVCGSLSRVEGRNDTLADANLIIEILSSSTEEYDRGQKFRFYQALPSFQEYLLVSQDRQHMELHSRQQPGQWLSTQFIGGTVDIPSLKISIPFEEVYRGVTVGT